MKKTIALTLALGIVLFFACKKKETKTEEPATTTTGGTTTGTTPTVTPVFTDGFKLDDNLGQVSLADSGVCRPSYGSAGAYITGYKGQGYNAQITFKQSKITAKTYPLDSIDLNNSGVYYGNFNSILKSGSITISSLSSTKASGTFTFVVEQQIVASTRTLVTGTFNNIKVK